MTDDDTITFTLVEAEALAIAAARGAALDGWLAATFQLGHANPSSTLGYITVEEGSAGAFVRDFVAWTSGRKAFAPGCEERLREFGREVARDRTSSLVTMSLDDA